MENERISFEQVVELADWYKGEATFQMDAPTALDTSGTQSYIDYMLTPELLSELNWVLIKGVNQHRRRRAAEHMASLLDIDVDCVEELSWAVREYKIPNGQLDAKSPPRVAFRGIKSFPLLIRLSQIVDREIQAEVGHEFHDEKLIISPDDTTENLKDRFTEMSHTEWYAFTDKIRQGEIVLEF